MNFPEIPRFLRLLLSGSVLLIVVGGIAFFHFSRHLTPGVLSPDAMDTVQSARYFAQTRRFGTLVVRPLTTTSFFANEDGTLPDLAHPPLYIALGGTVMRLLKHTGAGDGHREMALFSLFLFLLSLGGCWLLTRRLFGEAGTRGAALLAVLLYALGGSALSLALTPHPAVLAAVLFPLLLLALFQLDRIPPGGEPDRRVSLWWAVGGGALFGLLYLTLYSALALLPVLLFHLARTSRRDFRIPAVFLIVALLVMGPFLFRNFRLTRNPIYHSRLVEIIMNTETYPGVGLYRLTNLPMSVVTFTANHLTEMGHKAANNLMGFYTQAPGVIGVLVLPLFLGAALTRFTDNRVNRLRGTVYAAILVHCAGLSLFLPYAECLPVLMMYVPFAAALGASFLLAIVRARNLPRFFERALIAGWTLIAILPGLFLLFASPSPKENSTAVYDYLNGRSREMAALRSDGNSIVVADSPWEVAFRCDFPAVWMPADAGIFRAVEDRMGKQIRGVILSPTTPFTYGEDREARPWVGTYSQLLSVTQVATTLPPALTRQVLGKMQLFYPSQISAAIGKFTPTPVPDGASFALVLWSPIPPNPTPTAGK